MALPPGKPRRSKANRKPSEITVVDPTPEQQLLYNQIREGWARESQQQAIRNHVDAQGRLCPPRTRSHGAPSLSQSTTNESQESASPASLANLPDHKVARGTSPAAVGGPAQRRPRGRRAGPLKPGTKLETCIKRKFKFVCDHCKSKRIGCKHFDFSKLEEGYQAARRAQIELLKLSLEGTTNQGSSAPGNHPMLFGLETNNADPQQLPDDTDELLITGQPPNARQQDISHILAQFDTDTVRFPPGALPVPDHYSYTPGLEIPSERLVPIGSMTTYSTGRWQCEYKPSVSSRAGSDGLPDDCPWTGPLWELEMHFTTEHHEFRRASFWHKCDLCNHLTQGEEPPRDCRQPGCSPYGQGSWTPWYYGYVLVDSTVATSSAIDVPSSESEGGYSYDLGGSVDYAPSANGQNGSSDLRDLFDLGQNHDYTYLKTQCQADDDGFGGGCEKSFYDVQLVLSIRFARASAAPPRLASIHYLLSHHDTTSHSKDPPLQSWDALEDQRIPSCESRDAAQVWSHILCLLVASVLLAVLLTPNLLPLFSNAGDGPAVARCAVRPSIPFILPLSAAFLIGGFAATTWLLRSMANPRRPRLDYSPPRPRYLQDTHPGQHKTSALNPSSSHPPPPPPPPPPTSPTSYSASTPTVVSCP